MNTSLAKSVATERSAIAMHINPALPGVEIAINRDYPEAFISLHGQDGSRCFICRENTDLNLLLEKFNRTVNEKITVHQLRTEFIAHLDELTSFGALLELKGIPKLGNKKTIHLPPYHVDEDIFVDTLDTRAVCCLIQNKILETLGIEEKCDRWKQLGYVVGFRDVGATTPLIFSKTENLLSWGKSILCPKAEYHFGSVPPLVFEAAVGKIPREERRGREVTILSLEITFNKLRDSYRDAFTDLPAVAVDLSGKSLTLVPRVFLQHFPELNRTKFVQAFSSESWSSGRGSELITEALSVPGNKPQEVIDAAIYVLTHHLSEGARYNLLKSLPSIFPGQLEAFDPFVKSVIGNPLHSALLQTFMFFTGSR